jgi:hypothetical protein
MISNRSLLVAGALLAAWPLYSAALPVTPAAVADGQAPAAAGKPEPVLRDRELEGLGSLLGDCIASLTDSKIDRVKAQAALRDEFDKLEKRRTGDRPMLSLTADLGRSLWLAQGYAKQRVRAGSVDAVKTRSPFGDTVEYAVWVPSDYNPRRGISHPLLVILPDAPTPGQATAPSQFLTENWVEPAVRQSALLVAVGMPQVKVADDVKRWTELGEQGLPGVGANVLTALMEVTRKYAVDYDRIYLVGHGAAVEAAMLMASMFPDRFAGLIGRRGDASEIEPGNFRNLPSFFAGAGTKATAFGESCKSAGHDNVTLKADALEADIWAWIQQHARVANPTEVVLVPGRPFPGKSYWIEVPPSDGATASNIKASVDRETNTITIQSTGVTEVTLFFNDDLLDMDRKVKVVSNGREHPEEIIPRNFNTFVSLVYGGRNDPGKLYVASKRYDLSQ